MTKTTLNLDDQVLRQAKARAKQNGMTLTRFVEDALRAKFEAPDDSNGPFRLRLKTVAGDRPPLVDFCDRNALHDVIDRP